MDNWLWVAIAVAVVVVLVRRVLGEPLNGRDLWAAPVVLTGLGVLALAETPGLGAADVAWAVAGALLGAALGFVRGWAVVVYERAGCLWQRYTWRTFAAALFSLLVMAGFAVLAARLGMRPQARPIQLGIGVSFLGEAVGVTLRGLRLGVPFAPRQASAGLGRRRL